MCHPARLEVHSNRRCKLAKVNSNKAHWRVEIPVQLTRTQIDAALPRLAQGLAQYQWLQQQFKADQNIHDDLDFRRRFNHFYRVRRNMQWQGRYYALMGRARREALQFNVVLDELRITTNRLEASFVSKLIATIHPTAPVIDKFVLQNVGLAMPARKVASRAALIVRIHIALANSFSEFLQTQDGRYLVREFNRLYPSSGITEVKMLDLVLWQTRNKPSLRARSLRRDAA